MVVPELPPQIPRRGNQVSAALGRWVLRVLGWRIEGNFPNTPKCVAIAAPHTSNWDFPVGLAAMFALGLRVDWIAKHTLFRPPFGGLLRWLGGVSVDRRARHGFVEETAEVFRTRQGLCICIAPEGTRGKVAEWKSGFYRIAQAAEVPIVPIAFDWSSRVVNLMPVFTPSGDYDADLPAIKGRFAGVRARRPELACL